MTSTEPTDRRSLKGSMKSVAPGAVVAEAADPDEIADVLVRLKRRNELPGPPMPGVRTSHEAFAAAHGADPEDVAKVKAFADHYRLTVVEAMPTQRTVLLRGPVSALEEAFAVRLHRHRYPDGQSYRGREGAIHLPAEIADAVVGVFGLDNRPVVRRTLRVHPAVNASGGSQTDGPKTSYFANQLAEIYNFPTGLDGTGQKIGIVELGGGYIDADLDAFFKAAKTPKPNFVTRPVTGGANNTPAPNAQDQPDIEVLLDMEVAGAIAPGADFFMYFVQDGSDIQILQGITTAVHDTAANLTVLSLSFGGPEYDQVTLGGVDGAQAWSQWQDNVNDLFQSAGHLGITVCVSSGDQASYGIPEGPAFDGLARVDFPSSSPYALACGGTYILDPTPGAPVEWVWNPDRYVGTGGGVSRYFTPAPNYQQGTVTAAAVNPAGPVGRGVPDVAANAAQESGYRVLCDGVWWPDSASGRPPIGGTSAATPLWAGLVALMNQSLGKPIGFINPLLYRIGSPSQAFFDVTRGNNGAYSAAPGWDPCTGLGSPNGAKLLEAIRPFLAGVIA